MPILNQDRSVAQGRVGMPDDAFSYHAIVIRVWREAGGSEPIWRFTLSQSATNERHGFTNRQALITQLEMILGDIMGNERQLPHPEALHNPGADANRPSK